MYTCMKGLWLGGMFVLCPPSFSVPRTPQTAHLQIDYGPQGMQRLSFAGQVLLDTAHAPDAAFHIWHMSLTDSSGLPKKGAEFGWGENNRGRTWDATTRSWIYTFIWGEIRTQYVQHGDTLDVLTTVSNRATSGATFRGATIYPLTLSDAGQSKPASAVASQWVDGVNEPDVITAMLGRTQTVLSSVEAKQPLWLGSQPTKAGGVAMIVSSALPDGVQAAEGTANGLAVPPGQSASTHILFRFAAAGSDPSRAAPEAYTAFRARWPQRLNWPDRRAIGTVYLASAGSGDASHRAGTSMDPRRFLAAADVDLRGPVGLQQFQAGVLGEAETIVQNLRKMNGQGAITWDIEGQEYPPNTSYVCSPEQIAVAAPEMETVIADAQSKYAGLKLDDAYFKIIRSAGFRVGVCVRPQRFAIRPDGTANQTILPDAQAVQELIRKMRYAHDRWGATLFYLDSTVRADGSPMSSESLETAAAALPDSLLIPEHSSERSFRAVAAFATFLFHGDLGTSRDVRAVYPRAFSANLVNDANPLALAADRQRLVDAVRSGDILMMHADYWQANDSAIVSIYQEAKRKQ